MGELIDINKTPAKTVCVECRHFNLIDNKKIWYNAYCNHPKWAAATTMQDPVFGDWGYARQNSLGDVYLTGTPLPYARDINTGDCQLYESKTGGDDD